VNDSKNNTTNILKTTRWKLDRNLWNYSNALSIFWQIIGENLVIVFWTLSWKYMQNYKITWRWRSCRWRWCTPWGRECACSWSGAPVHWYPADRQTPPLHIWRLSAAFLYIEIKECGRQHVLNTVHIGNFECKMCLEKSAFFFWCAKFLGKPSIWVLLSSNGYYIPLTFG
jgi:hypothetical protein